MPKTRLTLKDEMALIEETERFAKAIREIGVSDFDLMSMTEDRIYIRYILDEKSQIAITSADDGDMVKREYIYRDDDNGCV